MMAPCEKEIPVKIFKAKPQPAILPILNASPPNTIKMESMFPKPGNKALAISCARIPLKVMQRQILICAPKSNRMEMIITNPKLVANCSVKTEVCVKKPGPMDELAIKKAAPKLSPVREGNLGALVFFNFNIVLL